MFFTIVCILKYCAHCNQLAGTQMWCMHFNTSEKCNSIKTTRVRLLLSVSVLSIRPSSQGVGGSRLHPVRTTAGTRFSHCRRYEYVKFRSNINVLGIVFSLSEIKFKNTNENVFYLHFYIIHFDKFLIYYKRNTRI